MPKSPEFGTAPSSYSSEQPKERSGDQHRQEQKPGVPSGWLPGGYNPGGSQNISSPFFATRSTNVGWQTIKKEDDAYVLNNGFRGTLEKVVAEADRLAQDNP